MTMFRISAFAAVSCFAALAVAQDDYQQRADQAEWTWNDKQTGIGHYLKSHKGMYEVTATRHATAPRWSDYTLRVSEAKRTLYEAKVHGGTPFRIRGNVLYLARYNRAANGCRLVAIDLLSKKELWKTNLQGIGPIPHFKYSNTVTLDLDGPVAVVYGKELAGKYVELVDLKTGATVGNRRFE